MKSTAKSPAAFPADGTQPTNALRQRITQAALDLFSAYGFDGATTAAIARRARVTERTLFRHFKSKKNLFANTVYPATLRMLEPLAFDSLRAAMKSQSPSFSEVLHGIIANRIAFARAHPEVLKLFAQGLLLHPDFRSAFAKFWLANLLPENTKMLRRARARGELRTLPDTAVIRSMISLIAGYTLNRLLFDKSQSSDKKETRLLVDILLNGIGRQTSQRRSRKRRKKIRP